MLWFSQRAIINWVFLLAMVFLTVTGVLTYLQMQRSMASNAWMIHTYKVLANVKQTETDLAEIQARVNEYLLTNKVELINSIPEFEKLIQISLAKLTEATHENTTQNVRVALLQNLAKERIDASHRIIKIYTEQGKARALQIAARADQQESVQNMADIFQQINQEEIRLLEERTAHFEQNVKKINMMFLVMGILSALTLFLSFIVLNYHLSLRIRKGQQLEEASRLKSEFLANMSHELRTPLNAIIGFSEIMYNGKVGPVSSEHKEYLGDVLSSARHLLQLINDVLDLAKVESGKMEFHPEAIQLSTPVNEVRDILRTIIASKKINLTINIDPLLQEIIIDPAKFKQILYNFTSNALKFTPEGGEVVINIDSEDNRFFRLEVKDTGIGIRKDDMKKLFTEFLQLDSGTNKKYQGTGLGLSLTKRIVEAQGGKVGFDSVFGKGSTFYALLPKISFDSQVIPRKAEFNLLPSTLYGSTVLVIEDNLKDQALIAKSLNKAGYSVEVAANGAEALRLANEKKFDAITLDLILPDMNGWEILKALRTQGLNMEVPAVVVTIVTEKLASFGFLINDFIIKPVQPQDLISALKRAGVNPQGTKSIMVVDDNLQDLNLAKTILNNLGYTTICESKPKEALRFMEMNAPDALVLDLLMPEMNGFEFLNQFCQTPAGKKTPIFIWTSKDLDKKDRLRLKQYSQAVVFKGDGAMTSLLTELQRYFSHSKTAPLKVHE